MSKKEIFDFFKTARWDNIYMVDDFIYIGNDDVMGYILLDVTSSIDEKFLAINDYKLVLLYYNTNTKYATILRYLNTEDFRNCFYNEMLSGDNVGICLMCGKTPMSEPYKELVDKLPVYFLEDIFG